MEIKDAVIALAALAQETRLSIFRLLVEAGPEGVSAGRIGEALEIPGATLSFHLKELARAGSSLRAKRSSSFTMRPILKPWQIS
jgi:DNA-binding transcriptional ArsR family regulator